MAFRVSAGSGGVPLHVTDLAEDGDVDLPPPADQLDDVRREGSIPQFLQREPLRGVRAELVALCVGVQREHQHDDDRREDRRRALRRPDRLVVECEQPSVDPREGQRQNDDPKPGDRHPGEVLENESEDTGDQCGDDPSEDPEVDAEEDLDR